MRGWARRKPTAGFGAAAHGDADVMGPPHVTRHKAPMRANSLGLLGGRAARLDP